MRSDSFTRSWPMNSDRRWGRRESSTTLSSGMTSGVVISALVMADFDVSQNRNLQPGAPNIYRKYTPKKPAYLVDRHRVPAHQPPREEINHIDHRVHGEVVEPGEVGEAEEENQPVHSEDVHVRGEDEALRALGVFDQTRHPPFGIQSERRAHEYRAM